MCMKHFKMTMINDDDNKYEIEARYELEKKKKIMLSGGSWAAFKHDRRSWATISKG